MGLPMFREPNETESIAEDAAAKLDRAAAQQRSSIRRQDAATIGLRRNRAAGERFRERRRQVEARQLGDREVEQSADLHIAQLEAELERLRGVRQRQRRRGYVDHNPRDVADLLRATRESFQEDEENVNSRAPSPRRHLPRPARESNLRFVERSDSVEPRRLRLLSPPSSSGSGRNVPDGPIFDEEPAGLTPGFAPARGPYRDSPRPDGEDDFPTPPPELWEATYPPLRRVRRLSPRPVSRMDGLGDRRRSPTPDNHEEATWANLLTTMDDNPSTAATSFSSDSQSRSRPSQSTATSFGEIGQLDDGCDLDLPSGITENDVREIRERHQQQRRSEPDGSVMTGEQGLRQHQQRRSRRDDYGMFEHIVRRMRAREDIPDEWWAAVGLSPEVVRNL